MLANDIQGSFLLTGTAKMPQFMATFELTVLSLPPFLPWLICPERRLMKVSSSRRSLS
jgi:hypothetical protein